MRAFLTGASGFVGGHLRRHLEGAGDEVSELSEHVDLADGGMAGELRGELEAAAPEVVYHLAALTHVGRSWTDPIETMRVNALGTLALVEAARGLAAAPRVVLISSAEVYGHVGGHAITEGDPLRPVSPYAASKVAAEFIALQAFLGHGLEVVTARPFNHAGPGQADSFVLSALAKRIVEAEREGGGVIAVGNLDAARDFTDVRDVVRAYRLLADKGSPGEVYNVSSGQARPVSELLAVLIGFAKAPIEPAVDPSLFRPVDVPLMVGDSRRLEAATGWHPEIPIEETLRAVLEDWRARAADS